MDIPEILKTIKNTFWLETNPTHKKVARLAFNTIETLDLENSRLKNILESHGIEYKEVKVSETSAR